MRFTLPLVFAALMVGCAPSTAPTPVEENLPLPAARNDSVAARLHEERAFWETRLKKDPYDFIACRRLAAAHVSLARHTGVEQHFIEAEKSLRESLRLHPSRNPEAKGQLAMVLMAFHKFRQAVTTADDALRETPEETWLLAVRGDAWFGLGEYEKARVDYETYHASSPGFSSVTRLAGVRFVLGDADAALGLYQQGIEESRGSGAHNQAWAQLMVGVQYLKREDHATARRYFADSLRTAPGYFLAMEHIAETLEMEGRCEEAEAYLEAAIAIKREPELLVRLAEISEENSKALRDEALAILESRVKAGGDGHLRALAEMLMDRQMDLPRALELAERDLKVRRDLHACRVMARALRLNGRANEAVSYVKEMLRYGTPDKELWEEAEAVYEAAGMYAELKNLRCASPFAHAA